MLFASGPGARAPWPWLTGLEFDCNADMDFAMLLRCQRGLPG